MLRHSLSITFQDFLFVEDYGQPGNSASLSYFFLISLLSQKTQENGKKRSPANKLKQYLHDMIFKFTIIVLLVSSAMASCRKNQTLSADTGFYSFKERSYQRNTTTFNDWTFDSVEVY